MLLGTKRKQKGQALSERVAICYRNHPGEREHERTANDQSEQFNKRHIPPAFDGPVTAPIMRRPGADESYAFNDNGNRKEVSYTTGTNNRTTADATYLYTYDKEGNRTRRTKTSDSSYVEYTWDHRNRLTKVSFRNSSDQTATVSSLRKL